MIELVDFDAPPDRSEWRRGARAFGGTRLAIV
jgi:hypothetical protein